MSAGTTYFWRQDKLEVIDRKIYENDFTQSSMLKYLYCPCVITQAGIGVTRFWQGFYAQTERFQIHWDPAGPEAMPNEFKLALLIAGVQL